MILSLMSYALGESATVNTFYAKRIFATDIDTKSMYTVNGVPLSTEITYQGDRLSTLESLVSELQAHKAVLEERLLRLERILQSVIGV